MPAASSIYWNSEDSQRSSWEGSEPNSSSSAGSGRRRYVDPWDLENYAYLRRRQIEIKLPRNSENTDGQRVLNTSPHLNSSPSNDSHYWYPMPVIRETGSTSSNQEAVIPPVNDIYIRNSQQIDTTTNDYQNYYPMQQAISYEDEARYVTPNPVYVPLSDIEYPETATEQVFPMILPRRRNRVIKSLTHHLEECPCPFHGPLPADIAMAKEMGTNNKPAKQLGLNTYGHLRIDYAKSWNSLHRKMKK